jgi:hypothetical protein
LLDCGDNAPAGTASADHVLEGRAEKVLLVDAQPTAHLGDFLHVCAHIIVALSLLAEASEESLAIAKKSVLASGGVGKT